MAPKGEGKPNRLAEYRRKRTAHATPEPFGGAPAARPRLFVVHKHAARQLHYDLRLEVGGVLHSWAVPKGPSLDPEVKRLAMEVEDHPIEYGDFEGLIPEGNYGAGAVILFDRGQWVSIGDPAEGLRDGKLLFDLWGYKLKGRWTLFRTKAAPNSWMLVKKQDAWADAEDRQSQESILSGRTVEQLQSGPDPQEELRAELDRQRAPRGDVDPRTVRLMLARPRERPFTDPAWLFELKYDGYRLVAGKSGGEALLRYRGGGVATRVFPEVSLAMRSLPYDPLVLDGEVVVLGADGRSSFQALQQRVRLTRSNDVERATVTQPATLYVFDILACAGHDLRSLPLVRRKEILRGIVPSLGPLRYAEHFPEQGEAMFEEVSRLGFEGIVAKRAESTYRGERSEDWQKIHADRTGCFAVIGFSLPKGSLPGIGALHLAGRGSAGLAYCGRVGTGLTDQQRIEIRALLERDRRDRPAAAGPAPAGGDHVWVEPKHVVEVRYKEWTEAGSLRHPVFLQLRDDKPVEDADPVSEPRDETEPQEAAVDSVSERRVILSNQDKVFWPAEGYTKGDLVEYYRSVAGAALPYLRDRPVVLTRYPDGIEGKSFFQKDAPAFAPDWIRTEKMWSEHAEREIRYFICEDEPTLVYLANLGTIPLHLWSSRLATLQHPDWCILDLDPKQAPFTHVVRVALEVRALCSEIGLECYVKTSGSSGLHVLLPLGRQCTYDQSRTLGEVLAKVVAGRVPEIATIARPIAEREGRVYIDFLQNGHGKLLVAPFSVRPLPHAPVSAPLAWSEVNERLAILSYDIRTVPQRIRRRYRDPWKGLLEAVPDLGQALSRLEERLR